jgi:hypothetical protein
MKKNIFKIIASITLVNFVAASATAENTNSSAKTGQALQIVSGAANAYVGKVYMAECSSQNYAACAMSVMSFAQAATSIAGALKSEKTKNASNCTGAYCNGIDTGGTLNPNLPSDQSGIGTLPNNNTTDVLARIQNDINTNLGKLNDRGYSYDAATNSVNTPTGSISGSSLSSPSGLKGLGMNDADISKMDQIAKQAINEGQKLAAGLDIGDGFAGGRKAKGGPGYDSDEQPFDMNKYLASLMNKNTGDRGIAGLEKKYGTDHIGVAQDNIFTMIKRRYEAKKTSLTP